MCKHAKFSSLGNVFEYWKRITIISQNKNTQAKPSFFFRTCFKKWFGIIHKCAEQNVIHTQKSSFSEPRRAALAWAVWGVQLLGQTREDKNTQVPFPNIGSSKSRPLNIERRLVMCFSICNIQSWNLTWIIMINSWTLKKCADIYIDNPKYIYYNWTRYVI